MRDLDEGGLKVGGLWPLQPPDSKGPKGWGAEGPLRVPTQRDPKANQRSWPKGAFGPRPKGAFDPHQKLKS